VLARERLIVTSHLAHRPVSMRTVGTFGLVVRKTPAWKRIYQWLITSINDLATHRW